jgi:VIT1/CCC1 family predicted Fe2+/Mn2+ transporter
MPRHIERHRTAQIGWLRAAVLGANDGLISTASLVVGVAASGTARSAVLISGVAGLVAGAMSMAAGEYVSVSSQADTENADLARERSELAADPKAEHDELADIYVKRGLTPELASQVAQQMMAKDALAAHAREELGLSEVTTARPLQAASASALTFAAGALLPVVVSALASQALLARLVMATALNQRELPGFPRRVAFSSSSLPPMNSRSGFGLPSSCASSISSLLSPCTSPSTSALGWPAAPR